MSAKAERQWSLQSLEDLISIRDYIAYELCNPTAAERAIQDIFDRTQLLENFPCSGTPLTSIVSFDSDYRYVRSGSYLVFYRYRDDKIYHLISRGLRGEGLHTYRALLLHRGRSNTSFF